ncbi:dnaJ homolog subfamily C member 21-like [Planococcus citri]|uniref:dnaJ homolog subfamily C member 21-like n=1 Tax=Planococcus citri TaxID=170843 RepID=UPI0031F7FE57
MKCHYDVLEIAKDASNEDLKKAYRKLALKWHPDKNPDNIDEAKREFILVQQAYEVLIDPQERAWYDRHRDSILKGAGSGYEDESLDVFPYFSASCYRGYDDSNNSFYTIYREVFNKLAAEESEYLAEDDMDLPEFGKSDSSYDIVSKFYGYWSSFCTKKTYSWLNTYDINEAENRRILRLMEQENKKVREQAKKERNEEIRALVQFVRKRDKRVQQYAEYLKQKTAENSKKAEEHRKKMIAEHQKNIASYKESDWSKFSNLEKELKEIESTIASEFDDKSDDSDNDDLYCVACNKFFRTEKSFANHEKSKKHKENAALLKNSMIEEEDLVNGTVSDSDVEEIDVDGEENAVPDVESSEEELPQKKNKSKKKNKKKSRKVSSEDDDPVNSTEPASPVHEPESVDELSEEELPKKKNKQKKGKNKKKSRKVSSEDDDLIDSTELASPEELISEEEDEAPVKKSKKNKNKKQIQKVISEDDEPFDLAELGGSKKQRKKLEREKILSQKQNPPPPPPAEPVEEEEASENTKSNKKKERKKKKDKEPEVQPPAKEKEKPIKVEKNSKGVKNSDTKSKNKQTNGHDILELDLNHECATCKESFDSKNKLFQHLTSSGHSILLPSNKGKNPKAKKKK